MPTPVPSCYCLREAGRLPRPSFTQTGTLRVAWGCLSCTPKTIGRVKPNLGSLEAWQEQEKEPCVQGTGGRF